MNRQVLSHFYMAMSQKYWHFAGISFFLGIVVEVSILVSFGSQSVSSSETEFNNGTTVKEIIILLSRYSPFWNMIFDTILILALFCHCKLISRCENLQNRVRQILLVVGFLFIVFLAPVANVYLFLKATIIAYFLIGLRLMFFAIGTIITLTTSSFYNETTQSKQLLFEICWTILKHMTELAMLSTVIANYLKFVDPLEEIHGGFVGQLSKIVKPSCIIIVIILVVRMYTIYILLMLKICGVFTINEIERSINKYKFAIKTSIISTFPPAFLCITIITSVIASQFEKDLKTSDIVSISIIAVFTVLEFITVIYFSITTIPVYRSCCETVHGYLTLHSQQEDQLPLPQNESESNV